MSEPRLTAADAAVLDAVQCAGATLFVVQLLSPHVAFAPDRPVNAWNATLLGVAALFGYVPMIRTLLRAGANVHGCHVSSFTPIHVAAAMGHFEAVAALVAHGASLDVVCADGVAPNGVVVTGKTPRETVPAGRLAEFDAAALRGRAEPAARRALAVALQRALSTALPCPPLAPPAAVGRPPHLVDESDTPFC